MAQDNVLGIQATINGKDIQQGADEFVSQVSRMEQAADKFVNELAGKSKMVNGQVQSIGLSFNDVVGVISKGAAALGVAFSAQQFVTQVARTRGEFQQLEVAFTTMLDSGEKASALMQQLTTTAAVTPFGLQDVAGGAKSLLAYGVASEKVNETLVRLGDIASGLSIPLNDLVYLYGTTMTQGRMFTQDLRQFQGRGIPLADELAKQFGVTKDKVGELVTAGKVGFAELEQAIVSMTSEGGKFGGLMEAQSKTIIGQWSNIQDAIDGMFNEIGKSQEGVINTALTGVSLLVENYEKVGEAIAVAISSYGVYKAAVMTASALHTVESMVLRQAVVEKTLAAASNIQLSNSQAIAAAQTKLFAVAQKGLLEVMKKVTAATLKNPYVMIAAAIASVGYATYKVITATTAADEAQQRLGKSISNVETSVAGEISKLNALQRKLKETKEGTDEYNKIKQAIVDGYGKYYKGLEDEITKVGDLSNAYETLVKNMRQSMGQRQFQSFFNAEQANVDKTIGEKLDKAYQTLIDKYGETKGLNLYQQFFDSVMNGSRLSIDIIKDLEDATFFDTKWGENAKDGLVDFTNSVYNLREEITQTKKASEAIINAFKKKYGISDEDATSLLLGDTGTNTTGTDTMTYKEAYKKAEKDWKDKKKALEDAKKKNKTDYEKAKADLEEAEKVFKDLGGDVSGKTTNKKKEKEEQISKELLKIRRENQEKEIALMKDGNEKKRKQIEFDYLKELDLVEEQRKEWAKNGKLTSEQEELLSYRAVLAEKVKVESISKLEKELTDKYQSNATKRAEIEKKYNEDIAELKKVREEAEKKGDKATVNLLTESIAKATTEKGKTLAGFDLDILKETPEYIKAFEDLKKTSTETLEGLLSEFEKAKEGAALSLDTENLKEYMDIINSIYNELVERNPFKLLSETRKEFEKDNSKLKELEGIIATINGGGKAVKTYRYNDNTGKIEAVYWSLEEAVEAYNKAKEKSISTEAKLFNSINATKEEIDNLSNAINELGSSIGGTSGFIISLIGDTLSAVTYTIEGMTKVAATGANALSAVEKASVILGIISTAVQLLNSIGNAFKDSFSQYEGFAEKVKEVNKLSDAINQYRMALIEARHEEENWFGDNNLKNLKDYKEVQGQALQSYFDKLTEEQAIYENKSGGGWLTTLWKPITEFIDATLGNIWGFDINKDYKEGMTSAMNNLRIETRKASSGFLGTGIGGKSQKTENLSEWAKRNGLGDLFDEEGFIDTKLAKAIIENYGDKLVGQTKETLEQLIELKEKYDEYIAELREYVGSMYEPLVDNFVDSLWDWFDEGKDALDSFKDYASDTFRNIVSDMMRTIVLEQIVGSFGDDIADIYEKYATGLLSEEELMKEVGGRVESLIGDYEEKIPMLQSVMENIKNTLYDSGIDISNSSESSQEASSKGFQAMTQETASELNGRFAALQVSGEEIRKQAEQQTVLQTLISTDTSIIRQDIAANKQYISEIVDIQYESVGYLSEISKNTKQLFQMNERLGKIETNTRNL